MTTFTASVAAGGDDGWGDAGGAFDSGSAYVLHGQNDTGGGSKECRGFHRWTSVNILPKSIINSASVTFYNCSYGGPSGNIYLYIGFHNADSPAAPTSKAEVWALSFAGSITANNPGTGTVTITGLASALQSVIDRAGWVSGNALILFNTDNGSTGDRKWTTGSYNGGYYDYLSVDYTPPPGGEPVSVTPYIMVFERWRKRLYDKLIQQGAVPLDRRGLVTI